MSLQTGNDQDAQLRVSNVKAFVQILQTIKAGAKQVCPVPLAAGPLFLPGSHWKSLVVLLPCSEHSPVNKQVPCFPCIKRLLGAYPVTFPELATLLQQCTVVITKEGLRLQWENDSHNLQSSVFIGAHVSAALLVVSLLLPSLPRPVFLCVLCMAVMLDLVPWTVLHISHPVHLHNTACI